jgi:tRNA A37 threonylcarbamoyladenosine dehydratase
MTDKDHHKAEKPGHRFDRIRRLFGPEGSERLQKAHVMVIGCGGVGSWAAETVTRSAVGRVTIVDHDTVCATNFNRQLQAIGGMVGRPKVEVLAERLRLINPAARVDAIARPFSEVTHLELLQDRPDFVIDAIDHITSKCFLISHCRANAIPFVISTGSGGRMDPTQIRITDLGRTELDPLARAIRQILRAKYGFPRKGEFGVRAVCSLEKPLKPAGIEGKNECKDGCVCPGSGGDFTKCINKTIVNGTVSFVTGAFGMACASEAVRHIVSGQKKD